MYLCFKSIVVSTQLSVFQTCPNQTFFSNGIKGLDLSSLAVESNSPVPKFLQFPGFGRTSDRLSSLIAKDATFVVEADSSSSSNHVVEVIDQSTED